MLTIWGRENSNNVRKVLWCAAELGLSYTHINAGGAFGKVNEESYRALNPNGLVPLLQDDDFVLWESNTIVRYLAAKFGDATFYPQDLQARAAAEKWMDWTTSTIVPAFTIVFWGLIRTAPELRDMAK
ncbi:glutathione S-transferase, partial [Serratia marcescens]